MKKQWDELITIEITSQMLSSFCTYLSFTFWSAVTEFKIHD